MTITWYGQSCFRLESKEGSILIDPFSKDIGLKVPKIKDDLVLVSHDHSDHNNIEGINPEAFLITSPGEYEKQGIFVQGIASFHDKTQGSERGINTIFRIRAEEMSICHLGDFGQEALSEIQSSEIGDVDILMIPVGGTYTINYKEAVELISIIEPKVIIPMHYKTPGLTIDLDGVDKFIKELGLTPEKLDKFKIVKKNLPAEEMKLVVFEI